MNNEQVLELQKYFGEVKKSLKHMSKNDLIRTIGALLLDKKIMNEEINRLNGQNRNTNEETATTLGNDIASKSTSPEQASTT